LNDLTSHSAAFRVKHHQSSCPWLLVVDHASAVIPEEFRSLGLTTRDLDRHIAYDIGALAVAERVADYLGATLIYSLVSRLVIDCNRPLDAPGLIPTDGDEGSIPGNSEVTAADRQSRVDRFWRPYHDAIESIIDDRSSRAVPTRYLAVHSMTDQLRGHRRYMDGAVLYRSPSVLGPRLADVWTHRYGLNIAHNQPYQLTDQTDYSVPFHAERRGIEYIELEMRQDLIADAFGQQQWAQLLIDGLLSLETYF